MVRVKKVIWLAVICGILVIAVVFGGGIWYVNQLFAPVDVADSSEIHFRVEPGETLSSVASQLQAQGIIRSSDGLRLYAKIFGVGDSIQAGDHLLHRSDDAGAIIQSLEKPPAQVTITIIPGWRREEIAAYLSEAGLSQFDGEEFLALTADLEGQLWPETYKVAPMSDAQMLVTVLHDQYRQQVTDNPDFQRRLQTSGRSELEIVTLASLLQREGKSLDEMKMIAGILYSRLEDNYPLQLCATAQYATGQDPKTGKWWEPPTVADTQFQSPYNTYVVKGLPPGPISSVTTNALEAALEPTASDYYYYLHDDQGQIHYATSLAGHERNKELYL